MRRPALAPALAMLLAACIDRHPDQADAAVGRFCETRISLAEQTHRFVDLVFVLGDDRFAAELLGLVELLHVGSYPAAHRGRVVRRRDLGRRAVAVVSPAHRRHRGQEHRRPTRWRA